MSRLYFAAKAPRAGQVKTRLGATIGMNEAARLYEAFIRDLGARFAHASYGIAWHVAPGSWSYLKPLTTRADAVRIQHGPDWASRQANLFRDCSAERETRVILAATDSPQLGRDRIDRAFAALETHDMVIGPTPDGGYYLVGMRQGQDIFTGVPMSTASALEGVIEQARAKGLTVHTLAPEFDVDVEQDLEPLATAIARSGDMPHTAAVLATLVEGRMQVA